jgi:HAD superfamily hydrolase (TIGR01509 family)
VDARPNPIPSSKEQQLTFPRIEAVIFDCDGVLVDSEPFHAAATREELDHRGIALPEEFFDAHVGMRVVDQMAVLAERYAFDLDELYAAREHRFWVLAAERFAEVPGSAETVRRLHAAGLKIAVATSGTRQWIDYVVDRLGLAAQISATVSAADVREPKPHPQAYLTAAAALGVAPQTCGVVEDSERGCRSAVTAGCLVVVLDRDGRDPYRFPDAAAVTMSMPQTREFLLRAATDGVDSSRRHWFARPPLRPSRPTD